jgi:hypothetical protein
MLVQLVVPHEINSITLKQNGLKFLAQVLHPYRFTGLISLSVASPAIGGRKI